MWGGEVGRGMGKEMGRRWEGDVKEMGRRWEGDMGEEDLAVVVKTVLGFHFGWWVNSPPILEPILVVRDFDPWLPGRGNETECGGGGGGMGKERHVGEDEGIGGAGGKGKGRVQKV